MISPVFFRAGKERCKTNLGFLRCSKTSANKMKSNSPCKGNQSPQYSPNETSHRNLVPVPRLRRLAQSRQLSDLGLLKSRRDSNRRYPHPECEAEMKPGSRTATPSSGYCT